MQHKEPPANGETPYRANPVEKTKGSFLCCLSHLQGTTSTEMFGFFKQHRNQRQPFGQRVAGQPSLQFFRFPRFLRVHRRRDKSAGHSNTAALHIVAPKYAMAEQQFSTVAPHRWLLKKSKESQPSSKTARKEGKEICEMRFRHKFFGVVWHHPTLKIPCKKPSKYFHKIKQHSEADQM